MATAFDVAAFILRECGEMSAMKLQKLVYYSQAWHLVWEERPLFNERIEAWANGPVVPELYDRHRGQFEVTIDMVQGDADALDEGEAESVRAVLEGYRKFTSQQLSDLTHAERPWLEARRGLGPGDRGNSEITRAALMEYYSALPRG